MDVTAHVFDLAAGTLVWRALAGHKLGTGVPYQEEDDGGLAEQIVGSLLGVDRRREPEYPSAPATSSVLRPIFARLASALKKA